eukprot:CAMPEP_0198151806 /NCGR_PEP_ID=MMETSP1443-20131203/57165_1 /TAXON_ID=186043 /ORGANISM="Entomoneis sp., Strain CCMP2396" /LENGTH=360 /DNA_ID=CAMNT_0043817611 /DNA_START=194 /DNA_END=1276 /DNA_ORIENTATION=+
MLPLVFVDAHHHFHDTSSDGECKEFNSFKASLGPTNRYFPLDYQRDAIDPITNELGISFFASVHVEALPDDGLAEAKWVESLLESSCIVQSIVASCDLTRPVDQVHSTLSAMKQQCSMVQGIRWILDVAHDNDQEVIPNTATHVACKRHDVQAFGTIDYLKVPAFEAGFACLAEYNFSFDLQCAPNQLKRAAVLMEKHPNVPVSIDHMGKLRSIDNALDEGDSDDPATFMNNEQLRVWKEGMQAMGELPHIYCKLSMLGYVIPGWHNTQKGQDLMKQLLSWVVLDWFGPKRCIAALNWHVNAEVSDSDGESSSGPSPVQYIQLLSQLLPPEMNQEQRDDIFAYNACRFYKVPIPQLGGAN